MSDKEMVITPAGRITIERATADDAEMLLAIHEDVARWLWDRGIHQWELGTFPRGARQVDRTWRGVRRVAG